MTFAQHRILGGDFEHGGSASRSLKEQLKRIGADPEAVRRAVIAAYEAEMNVVIHALKGQLRANFDSRRLDVEVVDEGPGIPDVDLALKEGYSTAPARARELGFGAGMGLPNIKRSSDRFAIESSVGRGTRVAFTIYLRPQPSAAQGRNSVRITSRRCRQCLQCLRACPTRALRIRGGRPKIHEHLCIDCTACITACESGALAAAGTADAVVGGDDKVLVAPPALLGQFGPGIGQERVMAALATLGFREVRLADTWEAALRAAVHEHRRHDAQVHPVISPVCPAVVNLIETRFPSLIAHLAPFLSPMEAAREELEGRRAVFVVSCPCQQTALVSDMAASCETMLPAKLRAALMPLVAKGEPSAPAAPASREGTARASGVAAGAPDVLQASGLRHVIAALEEMENGLLGDVAILEPYACDAGCYGSPLLAEDAFVARQRRPAPPTGVSARAGAVRRRSPYAARAGARLDRDMTRAIQKLAELDKLIRSLPGRDCGECGAPTCAALAEDIVRGKAGGAICVHQAKGREKSK